MNFLKAFVEKAPELGLVPFFRPRMVHLVIGIDGDRVAMVRRLDGGKEGLGVPMLLPCPIKRAGSVTRANFPADNLCYTLGDDRSKDPDFEWAATCHAAYIERAFEVARYTGDATLMGFAEFLKKTEHDLKEDPLILEKQPNEKDIAQFALLVKGEWVPLSEFTSVQDWFRNEFPSLQGRSGFKARSIVSGEICEAARLWPLIRKMRGGKQTGLTLDTFNTPALRSWGLKQCEHAPLSVEEADLAMQCYDSLLSRDADKRRSIELPGYTYITLIVPGDPEDRVSKAALDLLDPRASSLFLEEKDGAEEIIWPAFESLYDAPNRGMLAPPVGDAPVHILAAGPNGPRISIFGYMDTTAEDLHRNLMRWFDDQAIYSPFSGTVRKNFPIRTAYVRRPEAGDPEPRNASFAPLRGLLDALRTRKARGMDDVREIPRDLFLSVYRSALDGRVPLPASLLHMTLRKIRKASKESEYGAVSVECAAILKLYLNRVLRKPGNEILKRFQKFDPKFTEIKPMVDETCKIPAYLVGRLFALLVKMQGTAIPGVGSSLDVVHFDAMMRTPSSTWKRLASMEPKYFKKIFGRQDQKGLAIYYRQRWDSIMELFPKPDGGLISTFFTHEEAGLFSTGYYQERAYLWTKKRKEEEEDEVAE